MTQKPIPQLGVGIPQVYKGWNPCLYGSKKKKKNGDKSYGSAARYWNN